jgi:hypothetical protein
MSDQKCDCLNVCGDDPDVQRGKIPGCIGFRRNQLRAERCFAMSLAHEILLQTEPFITHESSDGKGIVHIKFNSLSESQEFYEALIKALVKEQE